MDVLLTDPDTLSGSTVDAMDGAIAITTRSIRDPAEGIYEYLEDRHEEQGLRQTCYLYPMHLSGWILRREGMVTKSYKRRFCVFDAVHDELWLYRDDTTNRETGKILRRLVITHVEMTITNGLGDLRVTGYEPDKELYKTDSARIASRHVASGAHRFPGEQQKFYQPQSEVLRAVSAKASTVLSHCFRHHMKNHRRRKRMMRLAEFEAKERWDLIEEELLDEQEEDEVDDDIDPEFVYEEIRKDPLDSRRGQRAAPLELVFDGESDLRITKNCDFSSLAGVRAGEAVLAHNKSPHLQPHEESPRAPPSPIVDDSVQSKSQPTLPLWRPLASSKDLLVSDHSSLSSDLMHSDSSIWEDEALLAYRVDFDSVHRTRLLASGSFGEVWLAHYRGTHTVAVKCLKPTIERKRDQLRDFVREIRLLSTLDHARIVTFVGVAWTMESDVQLLMEYMAYGDLRTYLGQMNIQQQATKMSRNEALERVWTAQQWRIAVDIIEGLVYLHSLAMPLVHCDLKSRNLLLDPNVRVKIADFGIARFFFDSERPSEDLTHDDHSTSVTMDPERGLRGTGRWLAPEILASGSDYTPAIDVYAFGVVLTEIDTFQLPFAAQTRTRDGDEMDESVLLHHIVTDGWIPKVSKTCPDEIQAIAQRCMAFQPQDRPDSLDVAHNLRKAMAKALRKS